MAGDWIKMEKSLWDKPEVLRLADMLDLSEDEVVGKLFRFWSWCDTHLSSECCAVSATKKQLDRCAGSATGFTEAMVEVGWLRPTETGFEVVNFDRHLGKSAKTRAQSKNRMLLLRSERNNGGATSATKASPEKRREEKIEDGRPADEQEDSNEAAQAIADALSEATGQQVKLTQGRRSLIAERLRDEVWRESWRDAMRKVAASRFCRGEGDNGWVMGIDKFLDPDTVALLLEGHYDDHDAKQRADEQYLTHPDEAERVHKSLWEPRNPDMEKWKRELESKLDPERYAIIKAVGLNKIRDLPEGDGIRLIKESLIAARRREASA